MKEKWQQLEKAGKVRLVILAILIAWCVWCVLAYTNEIHQGDLFRGLINTKAMEGIIVDGADFTGLFRLAGGGLNLITVLLIYGSYLVVMTIMSILPFVVYWFFAIRKRAAVTPEEAELAKNLIGIGGLFGVIVGILITGFQTKFPAALFTLCWMIWAILFVLLPLRRRVSMTNPYGTATNGIKTGER